MMPQTILALHDIPTPVAPLGVFDTVVYQSRTHISCTPDVISQNGTFQGLETVHKTSTLCQLRPCGRAGTVGNLCQK